MVLTAAQGTLFSFSNIDLDSLDTYINSGDMDNIKITQSKIVSNVSNIGDGVIHHSEVLYDDILLATDKGLVKDVESNDYFSMRGCLKIVKSKTDPTFILCLDKDGTIHVNCPITLLPITSWKLTTRSSSAETVTDLVILEDEGSAEIQVRVVTKITLDNIRTWTSIKLLFYFRGGFKKKCGIFNTLWGEGQCHFHTKKIGSHNA